MRCGLTLCLVLLCASVWSHSVLWSPSIQLIFCGDFMQLPPVPAKHCVLSRDQPPKFTPTTNPTEVARALPVAVLEFNALAFQSVCFKTGSFQVDYLFYYYTASNMY